MFNHSIFQHTIGKPGSILGMGYPLTVFLLLALPSTSYARDAFTIVMLAYLWRDRQHYKEGAPLLLRSPAILAGIVLITYASLSALWSQPPFTHSPGNQIRNGVSVLLFWFGSCLYFFQDDSAMKRLFWAMGLGLLGNILGAWLTDWNLFPNNRLSGYGILPHPNILSSVAVIQIAIGLQLRPVGWPYKIATIAMLGVAAIIVAMSISRSSIAAFLAVSLVWMIYTPSIKNTNKIAFAVIVTITAAICTHSTNIIEVLAERGTSNRPIIWQATISYASQHLWLGWGWLNDFSQSVGKYELQEHVGYTILHPHSLLVSSLYYGGIIGLLTHAVFLGFSARDAFKSKIHGLTLSLLAAVLLLTATDTHAAVTRRDFMLLIFWLPTAIIIMTNLSTRPAKDKLPLQQNSVAAL